MSHSDWEYFEERYGETREEHRCPVCHKLHNFWCPGWQEAEEANDD